MRLRTFCVLLMGVMGAVIACAGGDVGVSAVTVSSASQPAASQPQAATQTAPATRIFEPGPSESTRPATLPSPPWTSVPQTLPGAGGSGLPGAGTLPGAGAAFPNYTVDAMIGQVNGQALYASRILAPLDEQLRKLGHSASRKSFAEQARQLIRARLEQIVLPALLVGEAERALTDEERGRLDFIMKEQRAELLRLHGQGSMELAEKTLREQTGKGFEQTLREKREAILIANYMSQKLLPKVNVTQQDIERYYRQHPEEFNQPPGRTVYMIVADDPGTADRVEASLAAGAPFLEVASDAALNKHEPAKQGLLHASISGEKIFGDEALNAATLALAAGQHTGKIQVGSRYYWVYVEAISTGQHVSLAEAQLQVERKLTGRQRQILSNDYRRRLLEEGSFNPLPQMEDAVLDVAITRYLQPQ